MKLQNAKELYEAAPKGRYKVKIMSAEAKLSQNNSPMIALSGEIREGEHTGKTFFDYLITDESFKGAGMAKVKLRGLGVDVDKEQSDEAVCGQLLGREVMADLDVEQAQDKQKKLKWQTHPTTGQQIPLMNNRVIAYHTAPVGTATATLPGAPPPLAPKAPPAIAGATGGGAPGFPGFPGAVPKAPPAPPAPPAVAAPTAPPAAPPVIAAPPAVAPVATDPLPSPAPQYAQAPFAGVAPPSDPPKDKQPEA